MNASTVSGAAELRVTESGLWFVWYNPYGGMKMPHIHYAGEVYVLTEPQWAVFSKSVMEAFANKLHSAQRVTFDQVVGLAEGFAEL